MSLSQEPKTEPPSANQAGYASIHPEAISALDSGGMLDALLHAPDINIAFLDRELRYVRISESLAEGNKLPVEAHIGRTVEEVIPNTAPHIIPHLRRVLTTGEPLLNQEISGPIPSSPEEIGYWMSNYYPVRAGNGTLVGVAVVLGNITSQRHSELALRDAYDVLERRVEERTVELAETNAALRAEIAERFHAEQRLADSEARLRLLIEQMPAILWTTDHQLYFTSGEGAGLANLGLQHNQAVGLPISAFFGSDDPHHPAIVAHQHALEGAPTSYLITWDDRAYQVHVEPLRDRQDRIIGVIGVALDITEQTHTAEALRASEALFRNQYKNLPIPTCTWRCVNNDFVLIDYNDAAYAITRGHIVELVGVSARDFYHDKPEYMEIFERCFREQTVIRQEIRYDFKNFKDTRYFDVNFVFIPPDLIMTHTQDITERKQLEAQLLQAQKMESIGRLAGGIAHDFNNLLTAIGGYTELALETLPSSAPAHADMLEVRNATNRARQITQQLLAFARKRPLAVEVINLNTRIQEMESLLCRTIGATITLATRLTPDIGRIKAEPSQLDQVLLNLVVNARDAMPQGGSLTIETSNISLKEERPDQHPGIPSGDYTLLTIADTGVGMDDYVQAHLFEPFFTTKPTGQGTGLGLATCYAIIKQHRGYIRITSDLGKGTTVQIYLPQTQTSAAAQDTHQAEPPLLRGHETIMLVEDEEAVRSLTARILRRSGYTVIEAAHGQEALGLAQTYDLARVDLLLTDIVMPHLGGVALAERLTALRPELKVLFMSGYAQDEMIEQGKLENADVFLRKPFAPATLVQKVRVVLNRGAIK